jgi:hypothetical protein
MENLPELLKLLNRRAENPVAYQPNQNVENQNRAGFTLERPTQVTTENEGQHINNPEPDACAHRSPLRFDFLGSAIYKL